MDRNQSFGGEGMSHSTTPLSGSTSDTRSTDQTINYTSNTRPHSISHTMQDLFRDMTVLIEREAQLLRVELSEKADIVKANGVAMAAGFGMIFFGAQALVATIIIGLSYAMDAWLAAGIVAVLLLVVGGVMAMKAAKSLNFKNLKPTKSADALTDIGAKLKEKAHEFYH